MLKGKNFIANEYKSNALIKATGNKLEIREAALLSSQSREKAKTLKCVDTSIDFTPPIDLLNGPPPSFDVARL